MGHPVEYHHCIALLLALPLGGFLINGLLGRRLGERTVAIVACAGPLVAFILTVYLLRTLLFLPQGWVLYRSFGGWIEAGGLSVPLGLRADALTTTMLLVVTGVGTLIHVYATGYMHGDRSYARFFAYLNLFTFFMILLVLADNLLLMFVGWEGVGLCSYLLIGFWHEDPLNCDAGRKAFVVNRVGDLSFILGVLLLWHQTGTVQFEGLTAAVGGLSPWVATAAALLLFGGACGKSAQIPLHVWLPDAMAGPTPVSALIHAATMVTAGVYLVARLSGLYAVAPDAGAVVAGIGAATAVAAGAIALVQTDIKKVLAYSTVSQLGFMFIAAGLGAYAVAIFHLVTHAFFKALLFLGAGSVIHALHGEQDMRQMGGLWSRLPFTGLIMLVGCLALAGIPPLAGFASKDAILWAAWMGRPVIFGLALVASMATAIYAFRLFALTFLGAPAPGSRVAGAHESPPSMALPLALLAAGSVLAGFLAWPRVLGGEETLLEFLSPVLAAAGGAHGAEGAVAGAAHGADHATEMLLMGLVAALAGGLATVALAVWTRGRTAVAQAVKEGLFLRLAHGWLLAKLGFDAVYEVLIVQPLLGISWLFWQVVDLGVIDGFLHGLGHTVRAVGWGLAGLQSGRLRRYASGVAIGAAAFALWVVIHLLCPEARP